MEKENPDIIVRLDNAAIKTTVVILAIAAFGFKAGLFSWPFLIGMLMSLPLVLALAYSMARQTASK